MKRKLLFAYVGMVSGFVVLMLLSHSLWLEMRINIALVLPLFTAAGLFSASLSHKSVPPVLLLFLQGCAFLMIVLNYNFDFGALFFMPAIWLREGFLVPSLGIAEANMILVVLIISGNMALLSYRGEQHSYAKGAIRAEPLLGFKYRDESTRGSAEVSVMEKARRG